MRLIVPSHGKRLFIYFPHLFNLVLVKTHINQVAWDTQTKKINISVYSSRTSIAEKYSYRSSENHEKLQRFRFMLNEKCIKLELLAQ